MNLPLNYSFVPTVISLLFTIFDIPSINLYGHQSKGFLYFSVLAKSALFSNLCLTSFVAGRKKSGIKEDGDGWRISHEFMNAESQI